jgi:hypothetical protein
MAICLLAHFCTAILKFLVYVWNKEIEKLSSDWRIKRIREFHLNFVIDLANTGCCVFDRPGAFKTVKNSWTCWNGSYPPLLSDFWNFDWDQRGFVIDHTFVAKAYEVEPNFSTCKELARYLLLFCSFFSTFFEYHAFSHPRQKLWVLVNVLNNSEKIVCI